MLPSTGRSNDVIRMLGIRVEAAAGCEVTTGLVAYVDVYNAIMAQQRVPKLLMAASLSYVVMRCQGNSDWDEHYVRYWLHDYNDGDESYIAECGCAGCIEED